jgi:arginase
MVRNDKIGIIGVPQDLGASRRGVDMGPSAIRIAGLRQSLEHLGYTVTDYGNVKCHDFEEDERHSHDFGSDPKLRYLSHVVESANLLKKRLSLALDDGCFPLVLGGDHSISIGTMSGLKKMNNGKTGVLWVDAHADFNTPETTHSGNIHGMPLAIHTGRGDSRLTSIGPSPNLLEDRSVLIGIRDIDLEEGETLKNSKITAFTMSNIDEVGFSSIAKEAIKIATQDVDFLHVSFDIDALDPKEAPGTGTAVPGGLTYREAHLLMELVYQTNKLTSMELVEVNPTLDFKNTTAELAVGLISSALGKKILY